MQAERSREIAAGPEQVWALVGDARTLPRWWPRVERVEGVRDGGWTTVLRSPRGRVLRADWRLDGEEPGARRAWVQRVEGTPFERVIVDRRVEARLEPAGEGTLVTLAIRQRARKRGRELFLIRPARHELDAALAALARELEAGDTAATSRGDLDDSPRADWAPPDSSRP